jgi:hypothetical protein
MANGMERKASGNMVMAFLLGVAVVGLGLLGYLYYHHTHQDVVRIDVPGFSGTISKDKGIDINVDPNK